MTRPFEEVREEPCEWCEGSGYVEGSPIPTPHGPYYPTRACWVCQGVGRVEVSYFSVDEADLFDD